MESSIKEPIIKQHLSHAHRDTYETVFRQPASHNLHWREVRSMLGALAEMKEEQNGNVKVSRNGHTIVLYPDRHKDVSTLSQLKELREFLERSERKVTRMNKGSVNLLVVIDHREARIYRTELRGSVPERIEPYDPNGDGRHLHYVENDSNGQRRPERRSFYEAIAKSLQDAEKILLFGSAIGASSAMEQLIAELKLHHKDLAARIVGSVRVDEHHLTEDQLLAKAREFYATITAQRIPENPGF